MTFLKDVLAFLCISATTTNPHCIKVKAATAALLQQQYKGRELADKKATTFLTELLPVHGPAPRLAVASKIL